MSAIVQLTARLESTTCPTCGVEFAMPEHLLNTRRNNAGSVYCPSGHVCSWRESEAERLRKQVAELERQRVTAELRATSNREWAERTERQLSAARGLITKTKKRIGRGACPCCNRFFTDVSRHMASKHPDYAESAAEGGERP